MTEASEDALAPAEQETVDSETEDPGPPDMPEVTSGASAMEEPSPAKEKTADISQKATPVSNPAFKSQSSVSTTPSIKDALSSLGKNQSKTDEIPEAGDEAEMNDPVEEMEEQPPVSQGQLNDLWTAYIERLKDESPRIYLALSSQMPELQDDGVTIRISFRNNTLLSEFKQHYKISLQAHLKDKLNNSLIEFEENILDIEENSNSKYYTDLDKLKYMMEKNPALQKLRQDFNLDFE